MGFQIDEKEIFSSLRAARELIIKNRLKPMLFLTPEALEEFEDIAAGKCDKPNAVVIGLARDEFHYDKLNYAFRYVNTPKYYE